MRMFEDDLNDPDGTEPYEESPGVWICRRCAAEISHKDSLCCHCKRTRTLAHRRRQPEVPDDGIQ